MTTKKTVTKKRPSPYRTYSIDLNVASNGYVIEEHQKNAKGDYRTKRSIFVSTDALLVGLEDTVRNLRDEEAIK